MDLYNKYRPAKIEDMINTSPAINGIKKAVKNKNIAHVMVFYGPRGLGKTTLGMMMPYIVNCQSLDKAIPCLECDNCKTVSQSKSSVLYEYNLSSSRGIDTVREIEDIMYDQSLLGLNKVFLLNEAEKLTTTAQDAFKDPLEKVPEDTYFILTTNNLSGLSEYILDRCVHKYKFSPPSFDTLVELLDSIAKKEDIKISHKDIIKLIKNTDGRYPRAVIQSLQYYKDNGMGTIGLEDSEFKPDSPVGKLIGALFFKPIISKAGGLVPKDILPYITMIAKGESDVSGGVETIRRILINYSTKLMTDDTSRSKLSEQKLKDLLFITYPLINEILLPPLTPSLEEADMTNRMHTLVSAMRYAKGHDEKTVLWKWSKK